MDVMLPESSNKFFSNNSKKPKKQRAFQTIYSWTSCAVYEQNNHVTDVMMSFCSHCENCRHLITLNNHQQKHIQDLVNIYGGAILRKQLQVKNCRLSSQKTSIIDVFQDPKYPFEQNNPLLMELNKCKVTVCMFYVILFTQFINVNILLLLSSVM